MLHGKQVIRQLERGILEELEQLREPGQDSHICWQTFQQPLIRIGPDTVCALPYSALRADDLSWCHSEILILNPKP